MASHTRSNYCFWASDARWTCRSGGCSLCAGRVVGATCDSTKQGVEGAADRGCNPLHTGDNWPIETADAAYAIYIGPWAQGSMAQNALDEDCCQYCESCRYVIVNVHDGRI